MITNLKIKRSKFKTNYKMNNKMNYKMKNKMNRIIQIKWKKRLKY